MYILILAYPLQASSRVIITNKIRYFKDNFHCVLISFMKTYFFGNIRRKIKLNNGQDKLTIVGDFMLIQSHLDIVTLDIVTFAIQSHVAIYQLLIIYENYLYIVIPCYNHSIFISRRRDYIEVRLYSHFHIRILVRLKNFYKKK